MKLHLPIGLRAALLALVALPLSATPVFVDGVTQTSGFYDINKTWNRDPNFPDNELCWAASCSNVIQFWQDKYGVFYEGKDPLIHGTAVAGDWSRSNIFTAFKQSFVDDGGNGYFGYAWWLRGSTPQFPNMRPNTAVSTSFFSKYYANADSCSVFLTMQELNQRQMVNGLTTNMPKYGPASIGVVWVQQIGDVAGNWGGHAMTIWGYELNNDGTLGKLFIADSDDEPAQGGQPTRARMHEFTIQNQNGYYWINYDGTIGRIEEFIFLRTAPVLESMYTEYSANTLVWSGGANAWSLNKTSDLPTAAAGWTADAKNKAYNSYYTDGRDVLFAGNGAGDVTLTGRLSPKSVKVDSASDYAFIGSGSLNGAMKLTKQGAGTLTLNMANSYTGGTDLNGGTLVVKNANALGTGALTMNGGILDIGGTGTLGSVTVASLDASSGYFKFDLSGADGKSDLLNVTGTLAVNGTVKLILSNVGGAYMPGFYSLMSYGQLQGDLSLLLPDPVIGFDFGVSSTNNRIILSVSTNGESADDLVWKTGNRIWSIGDDGGMDVLTYQNGMDVNIGLYRHIEVGEEVSPLSTLVDCDHDILMDGAGHIAGSGQLTKAGVGTLTIETNNTYTGGTLLKGGMLVAVAESALGSGNITIEAGALDLRDHTLSNKMSILGEATLYGVSQYMGDVTIDQGAAALTVSGPMQASTLTLKEGTINADGDHSVLTAGSYNMSQGVVNIELAGAGALTKVSDGAVTLNGANSYAGGTTMNGGTLIAGNDKAFGTGGIVATQGALKLNSKAVSNDLSVRGGKVSLSGAELYSGNVSVNSGELSVAYGTLMNSLTTTSGTVTLLDKKAVSPVLQSMGILPMSDAASETAALGLMSGGVIDANSRLNFTMPTQADATPFIVTGGNLRVEGGKFHFAKSGEQFYSQTPKHVVQVLAAPVDGGSITLAGKVDVEYDSMLYKFYQKDSIAVSYNASTGVLELTADRNTGDFYADHAINPTLDSVSTTGGKLLDRALQAKDPQKNDPNSALAKIMDSVDGNLTSQSFSAASQTLAALAGSTTTALSSAYTQALSTQMFAIRNRMTTMGAGEGCVPSELPYCNMWFNADGSHLKLDSDGREAGYTLNSWGGTLGVDCDFSERITAGAAFSVQSGDLSSSAAESAKGDLDSFYVNLFLRAQVKRWGHAFILTGSRANMSLDRSFSVGSDYYTSRGTTNGTAIGAMYELSYDIPLDVESRTLPMLQPLLNVSWTSSSVDAYSETGLGDAGLHVGKQDVSFATIGLGARYLADVGHNIFNRKGIFEARAMLLQDMGDRRGEADVAMLAAPSQAFGVRGAEPGSTRIEVGAGLTIPAGMNSDVFVNANAEFCSGATGVSGAVGYRYQF